MKRVFSPLLIEPPLQYTPGTEEKVQYIFLAIAFHTYGPAQYIFFLSTLYLFGDHILLIHSYTASNK
jgi:hypothetical protein